LLDRHPHKILQDSSWGSNQASQGAYPVCDCFCCCCCC